MARSDLLNTFKHVNISRINYNKDEHIVYSDLFNKIYSKIDELDYFNDPYKLFNGAFETEPKYHTFSSRTGLPSTVKDEIEYYSQFIQFTINVVNLSLILNIGIFDTYNKNIMNESIQSIFTKLKNNKFNITKENEEYIKTRFITKAEKDYYYKTYNMNMRDIFIIYYISNYMEKRITEYSDDKTYKIRKDPLYEYIQNLYSEIINNNPKLKKDYDKFAKNMLKRNMFVKLGENIKIRYYYFKGFLKSLFNYMFTSNNYEINVIDTYKNNLFDRDFNNSNFYKHIFDSELENMKSSYNTLMTTDLKDMFRSIYIYNTKQEDHTVFNLNINKNVLDILNKSISFYSSSSNFFQFTIKTIEELMIESKIRNKRY